MGNLTTAAWKERGGGGLGDSVGVGAQGVER